MSSTGKTTNADPQPGELGDIAIRVSVAEANQILEGLGLLPFVQVYALIGKIQRQASQQLEGPSGVRLGAKEALAKDGSTA